MREAFSEQLDELERRILTGYEDAANTLPTIAAAVTAQSPPRIAAIRAAGRSLRTSTHAIHADLVIVAAAKRPSRRTCGS